MKRYSKDGVEYKPATSTSRDKRHSAKKQYFPVVKFYSNTVSDNYWLNDPQETRGKAKTIATNYIKNLIK